MPDDVKKLLEKHEKGCEKRHEEIREGFKEVRREFNGALKEVRDTMRTNMTWTLIVIGLGVSILGYLQHNSSATVLYVPAFPAPAVQTAPPQITSEDTPSILEQRNAETTK